MSDGCSVNGFYELWGRQEERDLNPLVETKTSRLQKEIHYKIFGLAPRTFTACVVRFGLSLVRPQARGITTSTDALATVTGIHSPGLTHNRVTTRIGYLNVSHRLQASFTLFHIEAAVL